MTLPARLFNEELSLQSTDSFRALYDIFEAQFPLDDEREPPEAFFDILRLNESTKAQRLYGPWREVVTAVRRWEGGPIIGGHVFGITSSPAHVDFGCVASVQGIYTFFAPDDRGKSSMTEIRKYFERKALAVFGEPNVTPRLSPLVFIEVNNPLRMSPEEIEEDRANSGDPYRRYTFWQRAGFRPLDFEYVQPGLNENAKPVGYLDLFCSGSTANVPAAVLEAHLKAFISISVLKAQDPDGNDGLMAMLASLRARTEIPFVSPDREDQQKIRHFRSGRR